MQIEKENIFKIESIIFYQYNLLMKQANNFKSAQTNYEFILGPIKIKDGLFMGDELAAKVLFPLLRISSS